MKKALLFLGMLIPLFIWGQEKKEVNREEIKKIIQGVDNINEQIGQLKELFGKESTVKIGTLYMKKGNVKICNSNVCKKKCEKKNSNKNEKSEKKIISEKKKRFVVSRLEINIEDGFITDVLAELKSKNNSEAKDSIMRYFTNKSPISLLRFYKYGNWKLYEEGSDNKDYVELFDVLRYEAERGHNFIPDNEKITLEKDEKEKVLELKNDLNSLLNFRVYTDFLGLIDEESNGIVSFEAFSKIHLYPSNAGLVHFFKEVKPYLNYSRFDNDDGKVRLENDSIRRMLSLKQKAFIAAGVDFNVFELKLAKEYPFSINVPLRFELNLTKTDTLRSTNNTTTLNTFKYGTSVEAKFRRVKNFGLDLSVDYDVFKFFGNEYVFAEDNYFDTFGARAELYYYDSKNSNNAFFLRFTSRRKLGDSSQNYASIQFGYKTSLNFSNNK